VLICLHETRLGLLARIDLPTPPDAHDALAELVAALLPAVRADDPDTAVLVGYEEPPGASHAALDAIADQLRQLDEVVGYHLEQAYRYLVELGPVDAAGQSVGRQAAQRLLEGGRTALACRGT